MCFWGTVGVELLSDSGVRACVRVCVQVTVATACRWPDESVCEALLPPMCRREAAAPVAHAIVVSHQEQHCHICLKCERGITGEEAGERRGKLLQPDRWQESLLGLLDTPLKLSLSLSLSLLCFVTVTECEHTHGCLCAPKVPTH